MNTPPLTVEKWNHDISDFINDLTQLKKNQVDRLSNQIFSILKRVLPLMADYANLLEQQENFSADRQQTIVQLGFFLINSLGKDIQDLSACHPKWQEIYHIYESALLSCYCPYTAVQSQTKTIQLPTARCIACFNLTERQAMYVHFSQLNQVNLIPCAFQMSAHAEYIEEFEKCTLLSELLKISYIFHMKETDLAKLLVSQLFSSNPSKEDFLQCLQENANFCNYFHPRLFLEIANYGTLSQYPDLEEAYASYLGTHLGINLEKKEWLFDNLEYWLSFKVTQTNTSLCNHLTQQIAYWVSINPSVVSNLPKNLTLFFHNSQQYEMKLFIQVDFSVIGKLQTKKISLSQWEFNEQSFSQFTLCSTSCLSFSHTHFACDWLRYISRSIPRLILQEMTFPDPECFNLDMLGPLKHLILRNVNLDLSTSLGSALASSLESLVLKKVPCVEGTFMGRLAGFGKLRRLSLHCVLIQEQLAELLPSSLRKLNVSSCHIGPRFLSRLQREQLPSLREVKVKEALIEFAQVPEGLFFQVSGSNWSVLPPTYL